MTNKEILTRLRASLRECNDRLDDITYGRNPYATTTDERKDATANTLLSFHNAMARLLVDIEGEAIG